MRHSLLFSCAFALIASTAGAQNEAEATRLFAEGQALVTQGKYEEACSKFEGSLKAGAGVGTMLNLGDCYEHVARPSSAYSMYRGAESLAQARSDARQATAHELAEKIRPHVSWLSLHFARARPSGYEMRRDGTLLADSELDGPIPADPGPHLLEARALDKQPWKGTFRVEAEGATVTVDVPNLVDVPKPAPIIITRTSGRTPRILGAVIASIGVASIGVGSVLGITVINEQNQTTSPTLADGKTPNPDYCNDTKPTYCNGNGQSLRQDALNRAHVTDVAFAVGLSALIGGAILFFTAPRSRDTRSAWLPQVLAAGRGGALSWSF